MVTKVHLLIVRLAVCRFAAMQDVRTCECGRGSRIGDTSLATHVAAMRATRELEAGHPGFKERWNH